MQLINSLTPIFAVSPAKRRNVGGCFATQSDWGGLFSRESNDVYTNCCHKWTGIVTGSLPLLLVFLYYHCIMVKRQVVLLFFFQAAVAWHLQARCLSHTQSLIWNRQLVTEINMKNVVYCNINIQIFTFFLLIHSIWCVTNQLCIWPFHIYLFGRIFNGKT